MPTEVQRRLAKAEATARRRHPNIDSDAAALLADYSLSTEWWERSLNTLAALTGTTYLVAKDDAFRASRETNEDRELNLLTSSQPPDAIRAALADPMAWAGADESTRHRMVKQEIVNRFAREFMEVVHVIPVGDFTAAELALSWGPRYTDRLCGVIARTGAIEPTGDKRDNLPVYRNNPAFDPKAYIAANREAADAFTDTHRERSTY